jgi:hypothetical protein
MEKEVLSIGAGLLSGIRLRTEGTMGPRRGAFWVVVRTGMERAAAMRRSFCVVRTLASVLVSDLLGEDGTGEGRTLYRIG